LWKGKNDVDIRQAENEDRVVKRQLKKLMTSGASWKIAMTLRF